MCDHSLIAAGEGMELECRVSIEGHGKICHVVSVRAGSVFHAAGKAL